MTMAREEADRLTCRVAEEYERHVYGLSLRWSGNSADAEDMSQDAFLQFNKVARTGVEIRDPKALLTTITYRLAVDLWRTRGRERTAGDGFLAGVRDSRPGPDEEAVLNEQAAHLGRVQEILLAADATGRLWAVWHAVHGDGLKLKQVRDKLGVPISTAHDRLNQARKVLAAHRSE